MNKPKVFILGKLPPPYFGPAVATQIIIHSKLNDIFELIHIDTALNKQMNSVGSFAWWKPFKGFFLYVSYFTKLFRFRPALILIPHGQTTAAFLKDSVYIILGRLMGGRILLQLRGSNWRNWLKGVGKLTRWYVAKNLKLASGVIILSEKFRYLFSESFSENRIFIVPNGGNFKFPSRQSEEVKNSEVLFFSNLMTTKGVEDVLQAAEIIKRRNREEIHFRFAGAWSSEEFKKACIDFVVSNSINAEFFPPASGDRKIELFASSGIFVFPPRIPEGHPWVIVEALAAGLPIISTDQGAISESVIEGKNGFIVETNSPEQIADKIIFLINNPEILQRMALESRKHYLNNFTEEKMIDRLTTVFNTILNMPKH